MFGSQMRGNTQRRKPLRGPPPPAAPHFSVSSSHERAQSPFPKAVPWVLLLQTHAFKARSSPSRQSRSPLAAPKTDPHSNKTASFPFTWGFPHGLIGLDGLGKCGRLLKVKYLEPPTLPQSLVLLAKPLESGRSWGCSQGKGLPLGFMPHGLLSLPSPWWGCQAQLLACTHSVSQPLLAFHLRSGFHCWGKI